MIEMLHVYASGKEQQGELQAVVSLKDMLTEGIRDMSMEFPELGKLQDAVQAMRQVAVTDTHSVKSSLVHNIAQVRLAVHHESLVQKFQSERTTKVHSHRLALNQLMKNVTALPRKRRHWRDAVKAGRRLHELYLQRGPSVFIMPFSNFSSRSR
jgi:hypothetical protein